LKTIIFDLGGVLIDHNPRYLYRKIFDHEHEVSHFLDNICTHDWNEQQDAGRTIEEATAERTALFPEHSPLIEAYYERWTEMLNGAIDGTVVILDELKQKNTPLYSLTNFSAETFVTTRTIYDFLEWFEGILVSGEEKLIKPDPKIYELILSRYSIDPTEAIFIDDRKDNIAAAEEFGIQGFHFETPEKLRQDLAGAGCL
jgi:2-haloacid dehalogenase